MAVPTSIQLDRLGAVVKPFERNPAGGFISTGEDLIFQEHIFDATHGGSPPDYVSTPIDAVKERGINGRYLWILN